MSNSGIMGLLLIILGIVYFVMKSGNELTGKAEAVPVNHNSTEGKIFDRFFSAIALIHAQNNLTVPIALILAVIQRESGLLFQTKSNNKVIGDDGNSIGYMQASLPAIKDVNKMLNRNFEFNDLYNEEKNLTIGSLYLDLCYKTALNDSPSEPLRIALKKYNGGRDETLNSKNSMADVYSQKTIQFYIKFKEFV